MADDGNPRIRIGGNQPPEDAPKPLEQQLDESETAVLFRGRIADYLEQIAKADPANEEGCTLLAGIIRDCLREISAEREAKKRPYLHAGRTVDAYYNGLKDRLEPGLAKILGYVDAARRKREAEAAAERERLRREAEEQRRRAEEAERLKREAEAKAKREIEEAEARRRRAEQEAVEARDAETRQRARAEAAEAQRQRDIAAQQAAQEQRLREQQARQATTNADALDRRADTTAAVPITTAYGVKATGRKTYTAVITDLTAAIRHARRVNETAIREAVQKVYDAQVRAGVRALPGATIDEDTATSIRTR